jgi:hypothetical protein
MMLRQEAALDRSIDRKVRILLRLRKESTNPPIAPTGQDDGPRVGSMEEIGDSDIPSYNSQSVGAVEDLKLKEQRGNVIENKGSGLDNRRRSGNVVENKDSYAQDAGMSLKRKGVIGNAELHATSNRIQESKMQDSGASPALREGVREKAQADLAEF